jgi:hypothetical protein
MVQVVNVNWMQGRRLPKLEYGSKEKERWDDPEVDVEA